MPSDPLVAYLWRWAVVLGVLGVDVFESVAVLLDADMIRGGNMLSRALVDYDIRLRFYIVQAIAWRKKYSRRANINLADVKDKMHAARDWENGPFKLASVVNLYDPELWTPEVKAELDDLLAQNETEKNNAFTTMLDYLVDNEARLRGVIPKCEARVTGHYRNAKASWRMQSAFMHGDQVTITDVYTFDENEPPVLKYKRGPVAPGTLLFHALQHLIDLLLSMEMLNDGLFGAANVRASSARLWNSEKVKDFAEQERRENLPGLMEDMEEG